MTSFKKPVKNQNLKPRIMQKTQYQLKAEKAKKAWLSIQNKVTSKRNQENLLERQLQKI